MVNWIVANADILTTTSGTNSAGATTLGVTATTSFSTTGTIYVYDYDSGGQKFYSRAYTGKTTGTPHTFTGLSATPFAVASGAIVSQFAFTIPPAGEQEVQIGTISNIKQVQLADGSMAYIQPSTKSYNDSFNFRITSNNDPADLLTIITNVNTLITAGTKANIYTHTNEVLTGYFRSIRKVYNFSGMTQRYTLEIDFLRC